MHKKSPFEKKVRVRVCGILSEPQGILLIKHEGIGEGGHLWSPPGGGVEFGERLEQCLEREFKEETNIDVKATAYLFSNEHIDRIHHAIELFFKVVRVSGELQLGSDPELAQEDQMMKEARFFTPEALYQLPENTLHEAFLTSNSRERIGDLRGLITFKDK